MAGFIVSVTEATTTLSMEPIVSPKRAPVKPDPVPLVHEDQHFALIIAVGPEGLGQTAKQYAFNVLGCFRLAEEAHAFAKRLNEAGYDLFDMYVVGTRKFIPLPPPTPTDLEDVHYQDRLMDTIMGEQRKKVDRSERAMQQTVAQYSEKAQKHNEGVRKATDEEKKQVRVVVGEPQSTPPAGVDASRIRKLIVE